MTPRLVAVALRRCGRRAWPWHHCLTTQAPAAVLPEALWRLLLLLCVPFIPVVVVLLLCFAAARDGDDSGTCRRRCTFPQCGVVLGCPSLVRLYGCTLR